MLQVAATPLDDGIERVLIEVEVLLQLGLVDAESARSDAPVKWSDTENIKWNFTKFLVGKDGEVIRRYAPTDAPADMAADIETALAA